MSTAADLRRAMEACQPITEGLATAQAMFLNALLGIYIHSLFCFSCRSHLYDSKHRWSRLVSILVRSPIIVPGLKQVDFRRNLSSVVRRAAVPP